MKLDLPWHEDHLDKIEAGAAMCRRHADQLMARPAYLTLAESDLERCQIALYEALVAVIGARAIYREKKIGE